MKVFISGISGTLGQNLYPRLLADKKTHVIGYSRDELKQSLIPAQDRLTLYLGDIRDKDRLVEATRGCDLIFHLAALKRVDSLEHQADEAYKTNVLGTDNILHAQRINGVKRVVLASTDKAVYPVNAYGASKMLAEKLVLQNPNNIVCRYGNVLGSRGSVLPMFVKSVSLENKINVTDINMTRFWITQPEAAGFVYFIGTEAKKGGIYIPPIQASSLVLLGEAISEIIHGPKESLNVDIIGMRPGEKIHECLRASQEGDALYSNDVHHGFSKPALVQLLKPIVENILNENPTYRRSGRNGKALQGNSKSHGRGLPNGRSGRRAAGDSKKGIPLR